MSSTQLQGRIRLPASVDEWRRHAQGFQGEDMIRHDTLSDALEAKPVHGFGSASKVVYADWLHFRVLWNPIDKHASHSSIFGNYGEAWENRSSTLIRDQNWYGAFRSQQPNPLVWYHMAGWKLSAEEITSRPQGLISITSKGPNFVGDNPFDFRSAPPTAQSHTRRASPRDYNEGDASQSPLSRVSIRNYSDDVPATSRTSPSKSDELDYSGGSGGEHRGSNLDSNSSAESGRSSENRLVNRFRPDEALINMSIISLLQALWLPSQQSQQDQQYRRYDWSIIHQQFAIPRQTINGQRESVLIAKTDGCFRARFTEDPDKSDVLAIIEVKPYRRVGYHNTLAVRIQEGAEMAAWIASESTKGLLPSKPGVYRRLLISQDFDEIYINIAEFDDQYIHYIRGPHSSFSIPRVPGDSPTRRGRTDERDTRRDPRRPERDPKGKGSIASMFKSSQREAPVTPAKTAIAPANLKPQRPGQGGMSMRPAPSQALANPGFLTIYEYAAFELKKPAHMEALFSLLLSLMTHLARDDKNARFRGKERNV